jgi:hypothetical protein
LVIDGEQNGQPTSDALGDDAVSSDEDGVELLGAVGNPTGVLVAGTTNVVEVTVQGVGGYLNGWMDFNKDGDFADAGEQILVNVDLNPGTHSGANMQFDTPADMAAGPIPARFRWGVAGLDFFGPALIGEVEDYLFANAISPSVVVTVPGDYDGSGLVDDGDYDFWKSHFGSTTNLAADGNDDGVVNSADYTVWRNHWGESAPAGGSGAASSSSPRPYTPPLRPAYPGLSVTSDQYRALMERVGAVPITTQLPDGRSFTIWAQVGASSAGGGSSSASNDAAVVFAASAGPQGGSGAQDGPRVQSVPGVQFATNVSPRATTGSTQLRFADHADVLSGSDLLLLDQVLAGFAAVDDDDADSAPVAYSDKSDQDSELELALAAAFEDDVDWRNSL